jgi:membrane-associated phospholipid phosphatase
LINLESLWLLILLLSNFLLYLIFTRLLISKYTEQKYLIIFIKNLNIYSKYILIIISVVIIHLIEVNFIDKIITDIINFDFANLIKSIEGDIVINISNYWNKILVYYFVIIYILIYPFTLWFSPYYYIIINNEKAIKRLTYGFLIIYLLAIPFYLFFPVTNVYRFYDLVSNLNIVIPNIESFFYITTTQNNCFPSLHVAMSTLIAWSSLSAKNKIYSNFLIVIMILVILSVIYLSIHWIIDVIFGFIITILAILILKYLIKVD